MEVFSCVLSSFFHWPPEDKIMFLIKQEVVLMLGLISKGFNSRVKKVNEKNRETLYAQVLFYY